MKFKKIAALCLAMTMVVSALTACGNDAATTQSSESKSEVEESSSQAASESSSVAEEVVEEGITFPLAETMEFTCMAVMLQEQKVDETEAFIRATKDANISVDVINVTAVEAIEKGNLLLASGDYPDFFFKVGVDANQYGMEGIFIPLEDLIREYAPNICAALDERNGWEVITAPDGHIYSLPCILANRTLYGGDAPAWLNYVWLENLGLDWPTNLDELYEVLKAFKEQDANGNGDPNDEIPYTFCTTIFTPDRILHYMPDAQVDFISYMAYMGENRDELVYYPMTESYKKNYLEWLTKMWEEGIIDQNGFTQTYEQMSLVGKSVDTEIFGLFLRSGITGQVPESAYSNYYLWDNKDNAFGVPANTGVTGQGMAITDLCENPEVLIAWADQFYTEEGGRLAGFGVEGIHYTLNEKGEYTVIEDYEGNYGAFAGGNAAPYKVPSMRKFYEDEYTKNNVERSLELYGRSFSVPVLTLTEEENQIFADINPDIRAYIEQYTAQVVTGQLSLEDSWDDYCATLKRMGVDKIIEIYQNAYARFQEK